MTTKTENTDTVAIPKDVKTRSTFTEASATTPAPKTEGLLPGKVKPAFVETLQARPVREQVLDDASDKISGTRAAEYGDAGESFARIAALWTAREVGGTNRIYTSADVAQMLALLKVSRLAYAPDHTDSWVDLVGYAALGAEVAR